MTENILTQELLHELFNYKNGNLYWKKNKGTALADSLAGCIATNGYRQIRINGKKHLAHRVIFFMFYGYFPKEIDHIDHNKDNNSIENLRPTNASDNCKNVRKKSSNKTGCKNVCWVKRDKKYRVHLRINGKQKCFGYFNDIELAELVAHEARNKFYKEFACHI
jgi:hypothetical protein